MKFYRALSVVASHKLPGELKILGLVILHLFRRRTIAVYLDPSTGCNLRCRMCYFSNPRYSKHVTQIDVKALRSVERCFYPRALKLQIGCGTEPTLYPDLEDIIGRAKKIGVPFISLTTNGQLLASVPDRLEKMIVAGLDEVTISLHGINPENYEYLMTGGKFEKFKQLLVILSELKSKYPNFIVRLNFTFNSKNIGDLAPHNFWSSLSGFKPDIIQLRPVQNIGGTAWTDYNTSDLIKFYNDTIGKLIKDCQARDIRIIAPEKWQLKHVDEEQDWTSAAIEDVCYCYISPDSFYKPDFNKDEDTYESYHIRKHTVRNLLAMIFCHKSRKRNASKKLNYRVK